MLVEETRSMTFHLDGDLITLRGFISPSERRELLAWANEMDPYLKANKNGAGRRYNRIENLPRIANIHKRVRLRLQAFLGVPPDATPEPIFGWYLSIISDGGAVHPHQDQTEPGMRHLRCNLFLQLPTSGGEPVVADEVIAVEERMVLAFFPSERLHSSQAAQGERRRIMCSFGYLVPDTFRLPGPDVAYQPRTG